MIVFTWKRFDRGARHGVRWSLQQDGVEIGSIIYLSGSRRWSLTAGARNKTGTIFFDYYAGTAAKCRQLLEQEWCRRSIGLFGDDELNFEVVP
jgi:hypothetical protein